MNLYFYTPSWF